MLRGIADRLTGGANTGASTGAGPDEAAWPPEIAARLTAGPPAHWLEFVRSHSKGQVGTVHGATGAARVRGAPYRDTPPPSIPPTEHLATPTIERQQGVSVFAGRRARSDESGEPLDRATRAEQRRAPAQGDDRDVSAPRPLIQRQSDAIADRRTEPRVIEGTSLNDPRSLHIAGSGIRVHPVDPQNTRETNDRLARRSTSSADDRRVPRGVDAQSRSSPAFSSQEEPPRPPRDRRENSGPHSRASVARQRPRGIDDEHAHTVPSHPVGTPERRVIDGGIRRAVKPRVISNTWEQRIASSSTSAAVPIDAHSAVWSERDKMGELQSPAEQEEPLPWPDLMPEPPTSVDDAEAVARESARLQRLDAEQRGYPWNA